MVNEKLCPVCGYEMEEGPRSYNICPSCGTEFGLHDVNSSIEELRELWVSTGPSWHSKVVPQPEGWNPIMQMISGAFLNAELTGSVFLKFDQGRLTGIHASVPAKSVRRS